MSHSNSDRKPGKLTAKHKLKYRREVQKDRTWIQLEAGTIVYPLTEPTVLNEHPLRQATRWPEDWEYNDFGYTEGIWVVCWIPSQQLKAFIRVPDFEPVE